MTIPRPARWTAALLAPVAGVALLIHSGGPPAASAASPVTTAAATASADGTDIAAALAAPDPAAVAAAAAATGAAARQAQEGKLTAALAALAAGTGVDFGVAMIDHKTGAVYTYNGDRQFETASVVKVEILATLLWRTEAAGRTLTADQRALADA